MVSALAEAKQIQEILSEYHEDTHIILKTDSSAAKANAERPGCGTHQREIQVFARRDHKPRNLVTKSGHEKTMLLTA